MHIHKRHVETGRSVAAAEVRGGVSLVLFPALPLLLFGEGASRKLGRTELSNTQLLHLELGRRIVIDPCHLGVPAACAAVGPAAGR